MDIAKTEVHGQVDHWLFRDDIYVVRNMDLLLSWIDTVLWLMLFCPCMMKAKVLYIVVDSHNVPFSIL